MEAPERYAVIRDGGHQYRVSEGEEVRVALRDADEGEEVTFPDVLLLAEGDDVTVGRPTVEGASVRATSLGLEKGDKVMVFKFRRRQHHSHTKNGHRQKYTRVRIDAIED